MSENPIEALLKRLINDPALLKNLEKMANESVKLTLQERERKRISDRFGTLDYINKIRLTCKLCCSTTECYSPMIWDKVDKLHRSSCISDIILPEWSHLDVRSIHQTRPTCRSCTDTLHTWSKEDLVRKVVQLADRLK